MRNLVIVEEQQHTKVPAKVLEFNSQYARKNRKRVEILGTLVDDILLDEAVARLEGWVKSRRADASFPAQQVVTLNPEYITLTQKDQGLLDIINRAGLVTPDGIGIIYAAKAFGQPLRGRVTGVELTHAIAKRSAEMFNNGEGEMRIFLLGAASGIAEKAAAKLEALYPGVQIVGTFSGKAGVEGDAETVAVIKAARADVVLVAYGMGKQDRWIVRNLQNSGAVIGIGVGGTFDYLAGAVAAPPEAVKKLGMEWAYRIVSQKNRWKRAHYVPKFIGSVVTQSMLYRIPGMA
jgi:N-acetylglucosaminyldiphosphoundecaprenol N-acetyl-beta-D-mannosaminyltransferase